MRDKPFIIPVFIPHAGCPHKCIYCNQRLITGNSVSYPDTEMVRKSIERFLRFSKKREKENSYIAFYGGTFTALPLEVQEKLLETVQEFVRKGLVEGVRFSTRPDCITEEELDFLANYPVKAIELGAQSMDDRVLRAAARGHSSRDTKKASKLIKYRSYELGIQIMAGLPKETRKSFYKTVQEIIEIKPDFVRIYPTLVILGSSLAKLYKQGKYRPLGLSEAVELVLDAYLAFEKAGIRVIRMGLQAEPWFDKPGIVLAGPYHPAFGELVISAYYNKLVSAILEEATPDQGYLEIRVPPEVFSQVRGHKGVNLKRWATLYSVPRIDIRGSKELKSEIVIRIGEKEWKINCPGL